MIPVKRLKAAAFVASTVTVLTAGCSVNLFAPPVTKENQTAVIKGVSASLQDNIATLRATGSSLQQAAAAVPRTGLSQGAAYRTNALFQILGSSTGSDGSTVTWDDATGLISRVESANALVNFTHSGSGETRKLAATVSKSPDATTGDFWVEVSAGTWTPISGQSAPYLTKDTPDFNTVSRLAGHVSVAPQGQADKKVELTLIGENWDSFTYTAPVAEQAGPGTEYDYGTASQQTIRIPHKVSAKGSVPKIGFDLTGELKRAGSSISAASLNGSFHADTEKVGRQDFVIALTLTTHDNWAPAGNASIDFSLENTTQKFKLVVKGDKTTFQPDSNGVVTLGKIVSTTDDSTLATITAKQGAENPTITYADGTTEELKLNS